MEELKSSVSQEYGRAEKFRFTGISPLVCRTIAYTLSAIALEEIRSGITRIRELIKMRLVRLCSSILIKLIPRQLDHPKGAGALATTRQRLIKIVVNRFRQRQSDARIRCAIEHRSEIFVEDF